jgi:quinolinate synthase
VTGKPEAADQTIARIRELKAVRRAVILAHSYQPPAIQDLADFVGDSLELSRQAASVPEPVIVFCGVRFMAETAHILAPEKRVLLPEPAAGCPLADCVDAASLRALQESHPGALTVLYVNSPADAKAESYACCTSANAAAVVESVPSDEVIFAPDRNLGTWVSRQSTKRFHIWNGACRPHAGMDLAHLRTCRAEWPDAEVLVHPETPPAAWELAHRVLGTGGMIRHVASSSCIRFIIGTEEGMSYRLSTLFPDRVFRPAGGIRCPNMKITTPEKVLTALETLSPSVSLDPVIREKALAAVTRMTEISG